MVRSLKLEEWPEPDRLAWAEACRPHLRLKRGGRAAHLKPVTRDDLACRFGGFLGFLERTGRLDPHRSALASVTPDIVASYVAELSARVSSVTVHGSIYKLRRAVEIIDPEFNVNWLKELDRNMQDRMRPKPKTGQLVSSNRIFGAGIELMDKAETETHRTLLQRASSARNGLLIAFLAVCPIRLKNIAALTLGETIIRQDDHWWLMLSDTETKAGRHDHRVIPDILTSWIDLYLEKHKQVFPSSQSAMWPSRYGGAMSCAGIQVLVANTTTRVLGKTIRPHMFRHCVPYTIANIDGSRIGLASSLLQHSDPRVTEKYYNLGQSVESAKIFSSIVSGLKSQTGNDDASAARDGNT